MIIQYPYTLSIFKKVDGTYNETTGSWTSGSENWTDHSDCRDEINNSGAKIATTDGEVYAYRWIILLPKGTAKIEPGTSVKVTGDGVRLLGKVIRFSSDQLHCRLWV